MSTVCLKEREGEVCLARILGSSRGGVGWERGEIVERERERMGERPYLPAEDLVAYDEASGGVNGLGVALMGHGGAAGG